MVNFTDYELLTASSLNLAFSQKADLQTTGPQTFKGQINVSLLSASTALTTVDLIATGSVSFVTTDVMTLPKGSTLQRPLVRSLGMIRANSDTGNYELVLGDGSWGQIVTQPAITLAATAPGNLSGPKFGGSTSNAIPVSWSRPGTGTPPYLYTLKYRAAGTTNWINWVTDISDSTTSATVSGLLGATRYEFQISARNTAGSTNSPITTSYTLGFASNGPPNLASNNPTSTTISLTWDSVAASPIAYQVRYAPLGVSTWTEFGPPTSDLAMTVSGLTPNQQYLFQVLAKNTAGSAESSTIQASTTAIALNPPNAPTSLVVGTTTIKSAALSWGLPTAGTSPFAYQIQYQVSGSNTWVNYKTPTTSTSILVTGLNSATNYLLRVMAINSAGSAFSANVSAITLSVLPVQGGVSEYQTTSLPSISGPLLGAVQPNGALSNFGITLDDPSSAYLRGSMIVSAACISGKLTMTDTLHNPVQGSGTKSIANFATSLAGAQAALGSLTYTAGSTVGNDSITITVIDQLTMMSTIIISLSVTSTGISPTPTPVPTPSPSGSLRTATGQATDALGKTANRASSLTNSVAIMTRMEMSQYSAGYSTVQAAFVENQINYVGNGGYIKNVRELCAGNMNASWLAQVAQNCGGFQYILAGGAVSYVLFGAIETDMINMIATFPVVQGVEGFDPSGTPTGLNAAIAEQVAINAIAFSYGLDSYQMAPINETDDIIIRGFAEAAAVGTSRALLTTCPNGPYSPVNDVNGGMAEKLQRASAANSSTRQAIVEFGYQQFSDNGSPIGAPNWVAESVAAKYLMEGIFDAYTLGAEYIGIRELVDADQTYGLFRNDGTPKAAASALRVFFQLMGDQSFMATGFLPGNLNYTITGGPSQYSTYVNTGLRQALFQSGDGTFYLWLWNEQPLNDLNTNATVAVTAVNITVSFNETFMNTVSIYDPFNQASTGSQPQPYVTYTSPTSVPVSLPAWPVCLVIRHP